jgi:hypothetical protein
MPEHRGLLPGFAPDPAADRRLTEFASWESALGRPSAGGVGVVR